MLFVFFFKQKTADEMRISDWSADVCSSDLGKEAEVDVDQVGGAAIDGDVIARLLRPRCRDLGFEIAGDEGGAGADLHGAEIAAEEIARVAVDRKSTRLNSSH